MFLAHGWRKITVMTPAKVAAYFQSLGLPAFVAYLTIAAEVGGGLLLIVGIETRIVALALVPLILGTIVLVHGRNGWVFDSPGGGWEFPAFWAATLVVLALLGGGALAIGPVFSRV